MIDVFESIKPVLENSKYVTMDRDKIIDIANEIKQAELKHWVEKSPLNHFQLTKEQKLPFLFVFNSISFSYWGDPKWTIEYRGKNYDRGTWSMIAALGRAVEEGKQILEPKYLADINENDLQHILRGNIKIPLLKERGEILRELGSNIMKKYNGSFTKLIDKAKGDALGMLENIINEFPSFYDATTYLGKPVYFHKRAQLLVSDINHTLNLGFKNIDALTGCADYKCPYLLRDKGALIYSPELAHIVDNKIELQENDEKVTEIRAYTLEGLDLIAKMAGITQMQGNDYVWLKSGEISNELYYPRIRTIRF